ncbi:ABC transporter ATP-binding protein [Clostridium felsineum]|uniref:ABC transporter ATP-binding protein n=1 Tax=Clostridium felsineum TaxID=36839 RepID=UPI00098C71EE|nr:ABC transporter ATP-binding protein [Clostridium felsineum]URZ02602.1 Bacitracin export ATP-binding protein BceA [Clostridium felsineum]
MFIEIKNIEKSYGNQENEIKVMDKITTNIEKGEMCMILGPSGSGKSTFLNAIGGIDKIDAGSICIDGQDIGKMNQKELSLYRRKYVGFIFQFYNLIPNLTVKENIQVCEYLTDSPMDIDELIDTLGLKEHYKKFPSQLSGGQQQRCAIARALIKNPKLLLCDEPTGALDYKTAKEILILMEKVNKNYGTTMLTVTHNDSMKGMAHHVIRIKDGKIYKDYKNKELVEASKLDW